MVRTPSAPRFLRLPPPLPAPLPFTRNAVDRRHLGDLFEKEGSSVHSNPTDHGFAEWFTSQAQLPTSTPNCGCFPPPDWAGPLQPSDFPASWNGTDAPNVHKFKHT